MMSPSIAIEARQLGKRIGKITILSPLDLSVPRGAIFALLGGNGAGKSTLIKLLLNIIRPSQGSASVLGMPVSTLRGDAFQRIGYISETQELPEWMTIAQLMAHLRSIYSVWNDRGLLESLQLPPERKIKHLSRGMRMKAVFASTLAFEPELLLMDEPFSGLDTAIRTELIRTLLESTQADSEADKPTTILISTHDLDEIESFATHVAFLQAGKLLFAEPIETLLTRCREVTVTLPMGSAEQKMNQLAEGCIAAEASGATLRFVDTRVNLADHEGAIRMLMPEAIHVQSEPMSLRAIFLALNKQSGLEERSQR